MRTDKDIFETRVLDTSEDYDRTCDVIAWLRDVCEVQVELLSADESEDHPLVAFRVVHPGGDFGVPHRCEIYRYRGGLIRFHPKQWVLFGQTQVVGKPVQDPIVSPVDLLVGSRYDIGDMLTKGLVWFINTEVLHEMGYALAVDLNDAGEAVGWEMLKAPDGKFEFDISDPDFRRLLEQRAAAFCETLAGARTVS